MNIVVLGARERKENEKDQKVVESLMEQWQKEHKTRLVVFSVGCDRGVGKIAREYCIQNGVRFVEFRIKFEGKEIPRAVFTQAFYVRNEGLIRMGDEFHLFLGARENGLVDGLVQAARSKVGEKRVFVYGFEREMLWAGKEPDEPTVQENRA